MLKKVYSILGSKVSSFIADEDALKFSSAKSITNYDSFKESFAKKLSLDMKIEIKYASIKSIKKEDNDKEILIIYKAIFGIPGKCEFSFIDLADYETFFNYLEKEQYFTRIYETLTPIKAIINYLFGLLITIYLTILGFFQASNIGDVAKEPTYSVQMKQFNDIVGFLGVKGVLAVGIIIMGYLFFKILKRYKNPPNQVKFIPPSS